MDTDGTAQRAENEYYIQRCCGPLRPIKGLTWSRVAGLKLASCSGDKTVRIWAKDASGEKWICTSILEEAHTRTVRSCSWSPGDRLLAVASFDSTVSIWEVQV